MGDFHKFPENALVFGQYGAAGLELGEKAVRSDLGGRTGLGEGNQRMTELAVGTALPDELAAYAGARDVGLSRFHLDRVVVEPQDVADLNQ